MNAYIVISTPPSAASETKPGLLATLAFGALRRVIPAASPDFEHLYERVLTWHVEIDASSGEPLREVGFDSSGRVVVIGPWRDNYGCIVDSNVTFALSEYPHVSAEQFEHEWNSFNESTVA